MLDRLDERFWYSVAAMIAIVEYDAVKKKRRRGTISYAARKAGRFTTKPGRFLLYAGWACLTAWLLPHLCDDIEAVSETMSS